MTGVRRRFEVVPPDWGQTHLTSDAVVAFVDDELSAAARDRAARHVAACPDCAGDVAAQAQARTALRSADMPALSASLLHSLRAIPRDAELPDPPAGLAVGADGSLVQVLRPDAALRRRRFGAGLAASGFAVGAVALTVALLPVDPPAEGVTPFDARLRVEPASGHIGTSAAPALDAVLPRLSALPPAHSPRLR